MPDTFRNFVVALMALEHPIRDMNEKFTNSNKLKGLMPLASRIWLEHNRGRHFSRIKLTYEIAPRVVSENTALRTIEKFIQGGYLKECKCHRESGAAGLQPTKKFLNIYEKTISRMIRDFEQAGFMFSHEDSHREDFIIWSTRPGEIVDAVNTEKWLGLAPHELLGTQVQSLFSDDWIQVYGGMKGLNKHFRETFDQIGVDSRRVVLTPTLVNQVDGSLVYTKVILGLSRRWQRLHGKAALPVRRVSYEVLQTSRIF
ncbi:MAG: hypothetical protein ISR51_02210 [Rhodospirillales bacterium]|nr:hypothetical protein [Alphaproteobacteria bacterium]MBL6947466.1 hypothetical protein [Rhodospirillales bacterium]